MNQAPPQEAAAAAWLRQVGILLQPEEAALFLEAAQVLLPPELDLHAAVAAEAPPTEAQRQELRALWLRTGAPPPAPAPMPLHPLAPGVIGASWRRLREAWSHPPRTETE
jgi:hypothetical protein